MEATTAIADRPANDCNVKVLGVDEQLTDNWVGLGVVDMVEVIGKVADDALPAALSAIWFDWTDVQNVE
jgi:hypothetical protein